MNNPEKNEMNELIYESLKNNQITQTRLAEDLGYTRFAFSKILHNKQKMYISEFLELSKALNLFQSGQPDIQTPYNKEKTPDQEEILQRNLDKTELDGALVELNTMVKDMIGNENWFAIEKYVETLSEIIEKVFCEVDAALEESSPFSAATYTDYIRLKKMELMLENQYVLRAEDFE